MRTMSNPIPRSTTSAEEVDTVAASEASGTDVVVDVAEDPASYRFG